MKYKNNISATNDLLEHDCTSESSWSSYSDFTDEKAHNE